MDESENINNAQKMAGNWNLKKFFSVHLPFQQY